MTEDRDRQDQIERLTRLVSAYGGDSSRWPVVDRARLRSFVASDPQAQRLIDDARTFDAVLDAASAEVLGDATPAGDIAERLMMRLGETEAAQTVEAAARGAGVETDTAAAAKVIPFPSKQVDSRAPGSLTEQSPAASWAAGAMLAASLAFGVAVGAMGYLEQATVGVTELAGLVVSGDAGLPADDVLGPVEEDFL